MNKSASFLALGGLVIGLLVGLVSASYFFNNPAEPVSSQAVGSPATSERGASLQQRLSQAEARAALLQQKIDGLEKELNEALSAASSHEHQTGKSEPPLGGDTARTKVSVEEAFAEQQRKFRETEYSDAMLAIENGDVQEATRLLYGLLNTAVSAEQREQAEQGLLELFKSNYERQQMIGNQTHAALWSLFEMHKLEPTAELNYEIIALSEQAYAEAQQYQVEGDFLASADRLSSLMHLSKMVGYQLTTSNGEQRDAAAFSRELNHIERQPEYLPLLQVRAEANLYNGSERERANVFWDYTKLATLQGRESMNDPRFREQFIESTVAHLEYLQATNRPGDVKSRMDYIRYIFPTVAQEPGVAEFN